MPGFEVATKKEWRVKAGENSPKNQSLRRKPTFFPDAVMPMDLNAWNCAGAVCSLSTKRRYWNDRSKNSQNPHTNDQVINKIARRTGASNTKLKVVFDMAMWFRFGLLPLSGSTAYNSMAFAIAKVPSNYASKAGVFLCSKTQNLRRAVGGYRPLSFTGAMEKFWPKELDSDRQRIFHPHHERSPHAPGYRGPTGF